MATINEKIKRELSLLNEQTTPVAGQYYCNLNTTQGHACMEIIDATDPIYNDPNHPPYPSISQTWTPGVATKISLVAVMPFASSVPAFYNDQQSCESVCGNHYFQNCSSSPSIPQSFYHLPTAQKNDYCDQCTGDTGIIKSHPFCWCLDYGSGGGPIPPLGTSTPLHTCPPSSTKDEYHMWTECSGFVGGGSQSMTWDGLPGYVAGNDLSNSQIFYDWIDTTVGSITVGQTTKINLFANNQNYTLCLRYDGVTNNTTFVGPWGAPLTIVSSHTDCEDCIKEPVENFACMTGVAGPAGSTTCVGPGNYTMGQANVQNIYPTMAACQADPECGDDPEERGCLDPMALNYNQCCDLSIPNCIPVLSTPECCEYEHGDQKGCMDSTAINYMTCCDPNIPNCVPTANSPECCEYEGEPDPCKLNPKECWFCTPGDIDTSDWQDPMALVNANGGCIQFLSTSGAFASSYSGQMYPTQSDCNANSECRPSDGETKHCTCCKKTENGTVVGFSLSTAIPVGDSCSQFNNSQPGLYGCVDTNLWSLSKCKNQGPVPTNDTQLSEEIKRYKQLL